MYASCSTRFRTRLCANTIWLRIEFSRNMSLIFKQFSKYTYCVFHRYIAGMRTLRNICSGGSKPIILLWLHVSHRAHSWYTDTIHDMPISISNNSSFFVRFTFKKIENYSIKMSYTIEYVSWLDVCSFHSQTYVLRLSLIHNYINRTLDRF